MSTDRKPQYLAIDFLHTDFAAASACAQLMTDGALEYMLAYRTKPSKPALTQLYKMTVRSADTDDPVKLSLIAKVEPDGDAINPDIFYRSIKETGAATGRKDLWVLGQTIRIAECLRFGVNIFERMEQRNIERLKTPVCPVGEIIDGRKKMPDGFTDRPYFSFNTSRREPFLMGHAFDTRLNGFAERHQHNGALDPSGLALLKLKRL